MLASPLLGTPRIKRPKAETDPTEEKETHAMRLYMPRIIKLVKTRCSRLLFGKYSLQSPISYRKCAITEQK